MSRGQESISYIAFVGDKRDSEERRDVLFHLYRIFRRHVGWDLKNSTLLKRVRLVANDAPQLRSGSSIPVICVGIIHTLGLRNYLALEA